MRLPSYPCFGQQGLSSSCCSYLHLVCRLEARLRSYLAGHQLGEPEWSTNSSPLSRHGRGYDGIFRNLNEAERIFECGEWQRHGAEEFVEEPSIYAVECEDEDENGDEDGNEDLVKVEEEEVTKDSQVQQYDEQYSPSEQMQVERQRVGVMERSKNHAHIAKGPEERTPGQDEEDPCPDCSGTATWTYRCAACGGSGYV